MTSAGEKSVTAEAGTDSPGDGTAILFLRASLVVDPDIVAIDLHGPRANPFDEREVICPPKRTIRLAVLDDGNGLGDTDALQLGRNYGVTLGLIGVAQAFVRRGNRKYRDAVPDDDGIGRRVFQPAAGRTDFKRL